MQRLRQRPTLCGKKSPDRSGSIDSLIKLKTHSLLKDSADRSGSIDTPIEAKTHCLLKQECRWVRQCRRISQGKISPSVVRRVQTGQALYSHRSRQRPTSCGKESPYRSGSIDTLIEVKTHQLLEEEYRGNCPVFFVLVVDTLHRIIAQVCEQNFQCLANCPEH